MTEPTVGAAAPEAAAPRERGWGRIIAVLALVLFVPALGPFRLFAPVEQTLYLLVPAVAALMIVGWRRGGSAFQALAWTALAAWTLLRPGVNALGASPAFATLAAGWGLVLAAAFGAMGLAAARWPFLPRALASLAAAGIVATAGTTVGHGRGALTAEIIRQELGRRGDETAMQLRQFVQAMQQDPKAADAEDAIASFSQLEKAVTLLPTVAVLVVPAALALESLAVLALAWALYHRLARTRVGPPLAALREFRFSDQLVWGIIAGLVIALIPGLAQLRGVGANLLLFFGALYAVRGLGVLVYFLAPGPVLSALAVVGAFLAWPLVTAFTFGIGLGDTWIDWRRRAARPAP